MHRVLALLHVHGVEALTANEFVGLSRRRVVWAAVEVVVAGTAAQGVLHGPAVEGVVAVGALEDVVAPAAVDVLC